MFIRRDSMNLIKDGRVIEVTEKAYNTIYKDKGYVPYNADNVGKKAKDEDGIDDLTKAEIIEQLEEKEIEHNPRDVKKDLFKLLGSE